MLLNNVYAACAEHFYLRLPRFVWFVCCGFYGCHHDTHFCIFRRHKYQQSRKSREQTNVNCQSYFSAFAFSLLIFYETEIRDASRVLQAKKKTEKKTEKGITRQVMCANCSPVTCYLHLYWPMDWQLIINVGNRIANYFFHFFFNYFCKIR